MNLREKISYLFGNNRTKPTKRSNDVVVKYTGAPSYGYVTKPYPALTNSVVYRGVSILSDSVASLPIDIYRRKTNGYWQVDEKNSIHTVLTRRANRRQTPYELLEGIVTQMLMYGNAYIYIKRNGKGDIAELVLISPDCCYYNVEQDEYTITDIYNGIRGTFTEDKIIHLRNKSLENIIGKPLTDYCARTLGIAGAVDKESLKSLSNGMRLKGFISNDSSVIGFSEDTDEQLVDIQGVMQDQLNSGQDIIAMPSGVKFQAVSQTNRDAMVLENKQYTLSDLARFIGVSPSKLYISTGGNYIASEQEQVNFYNDTLDPLLHKIEEAFNEKLIPDSVGNKYKIEFNRLHLSYYDAVLDTMQKAVQLGIYSTNDVRRLYNQQPVESGDEVLLSANLKTLSALKADGEKKEVEQTKPIEEETTEETDEKIEETPKEDTKQPLNE